MFSQRKYPIHPIGPQTLLLLRFVVFWFISDRSVSLRYSVENRPNYCNKCKSSSHKVAIEFFATNLPNPRHLILNSCYGMFHSVWGHSGAFCYGSKLGAKLAEQVQLMQKFVPQSRVRCFHNESTQSTPLDPKLFFCCVS